jgi:hypothetical protein
VFVAAGREGDVPEVPQDYAARAGDPEVTAACSCEHCGHLADNKLALNAGWDLEMLSLEIGELGEADACLAAQQDHLALAGNRSPPAAQQQLDFLLAPGKRCQGRAAQCFKAADDSAVRHDPPRRPGRRPQR